MKPSKFTGPTLFACPNGHEQNFRYYPVYVDGEDNKPACQRCHMEWVAETFPTFEEPAPSTDTGEGGE